MELPSGKVECPYCHKEFSSRRYYRSHFQYAANQSCTLAMQAKSTQQLPQKRTQPDDILDETIKETTDPLLKQHHYTTQMFNKLLGTSGSADKDWECEFEFEDGLEFEAADGMGLGNFGSNSDENEGFGLTDNDDGEEDNIDNNANLDDNNTNPGNNEVNPGDVPRKPPDETIYQDFLQYQQYATQNYCSFDDNHRAGIQLLDLLVKNRAPLNLYDSIYQWHMENAQATKQLPKSTLMADLKKRYNMEKKRGPQVMPLTLPHSGCRINLVYQAFAHELQILLTDPRIVDDDYLFFDDNPLAGPPPNLDYIEDINTGLAYTQTYKQLIKDPTKEVLLPVLFYMDGAVTGQYDHLPIEILKFTLGIFKSGTRNKLHAWRNLGYVAKFLKEETIARDIVRESQHMDSDFYLFGDDLVTDATNNNPEQDIDEDSDSDSSDLEADGARKIKSCSGQDLHAMLTAMLASYAKYECGIRWDLRYKGKTYEVVFIPFVMFVKGDSVEHDKHCGKYNARGEGVKQLCRYCQCPNEDTDNPDASYPRKSPNLIKPLVAAKNQEGLKAISQQYIKNSWYNLRFGLHNDLGIHGACPIELLHWLNLGKQKYLREMFFGQTGDDTILANKINAICKSLGILFKRQSEKDLPRTDFPKGVKKGKLMAHEMSGVMLILVACLRCAKGRTTMLNDCRGATQKQSFGRPELIRDWVLLLETYLQFEVWLKQPRLRTFHVNRLRDKIKELMKLEKKIGNRQKGMGHRTFNFHSALHIVDDMLNFGVPSNVNTQSNEMHHKASKTAAIHTQRRAKTFDMQCANNLHDMDVIDFAMEELSSHAKKWDYFAEFEEDDSVDEVETEGVNTINTGTRAEFFWSYAKSDFTLKVKSEMQGKDQFKLGSELEAFLREIHDGFGGDVSTINIFTEHKREGIIFRGSPYYRGSPCRHWVMVNWGNEVILPAQIWCFLDLTDVPPDMTYEPGIYAVVESAKASTNQQEIKMSELFVPYLKETKGTDENGQKKRKFYLVDVESFVSTACVIPDLGNKNPAAFLRLLPRHLWKNQFIAWLCSENAIDFD